MKGNGLANLDAVNGAVLSVFKIGSDEYKQFSERLAGIYQDLDLSYNQTKTISELVMEMAKKDYASALEFSKFLQALVDATDQESREKLFEQLGFLDLDNPNQIKQFFEALNAAEIEIDFTNFEYSLDDAADQIIEWANAIARIDFESLLEEITENVSLMRDIKDRKATDRTFSADEFSVLRAAGINAD